MAINNISNPDYYYKKAKSRSNWTTGDLKYLIDFISTKHMSGFVNNILEIGCGTAESLKYLPSEISYTGIDSGEYSIGECKKEHSKHDFMLAQAENLPFGDKSFDLVFSVQVLEMLSNPRQGLTEMIRVVRPGGHVIIIAPNLEMPWSEIHSVRHYSRQGHILIFLERCFDAFLRFFGRLSFRIIEQTHAEATDKFEKSDDDLKYITSAWEIAHVFKKAGFKEIISKKKHFKNNSLKNIVKLLITKMPTLHYYGSGMFFIFQKPSN